MNDDRTLVMLADAFARLGATTAQSRVMAVQLLKRARQRAADLGVTEESALAELLAKVAAGRSGEYRGDDATDTGKSV